MTGLNILVPFSAESIPDATLLNIFVCKKDRAVKLEKQGLAELSISWAATRRPFRQATLSMRMSLVWIRFDEPSWLAFVGSR